MALVTYSDSEGESEGENEAQSSGAPPKTSRADRSEAGKIKLQVPSIKPEPGKDAASEPPTKRAKVGGGAFSGFNSMLPPPKKATKSAPKPGTSFKTSSEAAFSRDAPPFEQSISEEGRTSTAGTSVQPEPRLVGNPMKFLPLSVANKKKKKPVQRATPTAVDKEVESSVQSNRNRPLFTLQPEADGTPKALSDEQSANTLDDPPTPSFESSRTGSRNTVEALASEMKLTAAQRRQLFGRHSKDVNITHFNMDSEYAANEELRQAGEISQHRAVKSIAPGKHSLQQLVNNAKTQQDAMEDAWAEGRRNRGEGGSKYGWK